MAETPVEKYRRQLRELEERRKNNEIADDKYFENLEELRKNLSYAQYSQTAILDEDNKVFVPGKKVRRLMSEVDNYLYGIGKKPIYLDLARKYTQEGKTFEEAVQLAKEEIGRKTRNERYTTGEFIDREDKSLQDSSFAVSDIVDPVEGTIKDPQTGIVRKASFLELLGSGLLERQRKPTKLTTRLARSQFEKDQENYIEDLRTQRKITKKASEIRNLAYSRKPVDLNTLLKSVELTEEEEESIQRQAEERGPMTRLDVRQRPEDPAVIAETDTEYLFRVINSMGAALDPAVGALQDAIGAFTGAPPRIREERFKKTKIDYPLGVGQFLTNLLTGQSSFDRIEAGKLPPDEAASWYDVTTQGTLGSQVTSILPGFIEPLTPLPLIKGGAKLASTALRTSKNLAAQKAALALEAPIDAYMYFGKRAQVDQAVRSIGIKEGAKKIEQEILRDGGALRTASLRKKASENIADQYATRMNAKRIIEETDPRKMVRPDDFGNPNNVIVQEIFKGAKEVPVSRVKEVIDKMDEVFKGLSAGSKEVGLIVTHFFLSLLLTVANAFPA